MSAATRTLLGALLRSAAGAAAGGAVGLSIAEFWPYPANLAVVNAVSISVIWIGVIVGLGWSRMYADRARRR